jgi:hypothetical protein
MRSFRRSGAGVLALLVVLGACAEQTTSPAARVEALGAELARGPGQQPIPTRSEEQPGTWIDLSDADLWKHIAAADHTAVVGLKAPDAVRGVYRGRILLERAEWAEARRSVATPRGITVLAMDTLLPLVEVRIETLAALRAIRRDPRVDYIEPIRAASDMDPWASTGGCGWPGAWGGDWVKSPTGDGYSARFTAMRIPDAWSVSNGQGVTLGLIDTGIATTQTELRAGFAGGSVPSRTARHYFLPKFGSSDDACGHGTRMAGTMVAPDDGRGVVGVAWGADLVTVRHANGVANVSTTDARRGVRTAGDHGARIVTMAWQSMNYFWQVSDEIKWWHYNRGLLFLAAAGTSGCGDLIPDNNVVFPAQMGEVVAVTGISYPGGGMPCGIHYGSQVELTAFLDVPTTGRHPGEVTSVGGSSNAVGIVAGVAALAWQRNPQMTRDQLRRRLQESGSYFPSRHGREGFGLVNAYKAVTGVAAPGAGSTGD